MAVIYRSKKTWPEIRAEIDKRQQREMAELTAIECNHDRLDYRRYPIAGGRFQLRQQCLNCWELVGGALKRDLVRDFEALPIVNEVARQKAQNRWQDRQAVFERHREEKQQAFWDYYNEHLNSAEWREKCRLKRERAGNVCEGCGLAPVNHVHHLSYDNLGDELLFELVALCRGCHQKLHPHREIA